MKLDSCEFAYWYSENNGICLYKTKGKFFIDIFRNSRCITKSWTEISKEKYFRKLHKVLEHEGIKKGIKK